MHGSNRLGGNSLSDLLVFGRRAGAGAAAYVAAAGRPAPGRSPRPTSSAAADAWRSAPFAADAGREPLHAAPELQQTMNDLVGIIRREGEMSEALERLAALPRAAATASASKATGSSTRAGTWRWTCATCC